MPITPSYANVNSSPVWELRATAVDSCKGKSWETHPGWVVSLALSHPLYKEIRKLH